MTTTTREELAQIRADVLAEAEATRAGGGAPTFYALPGQKALHVARSPEAAASLKARYAAACGLKTEDAGEVGGGD